MHTKTHWEDVYETKSSTEVSWYQDHSALSLRMIVGTGIGGSAGIIDVGGGASTLAADLLAKGIRDITVLDISGSALRAAQEQMGAQANLVTWLEADITSVDLPKHRYDVWHDRAVFHFLTRAEDRARYVRAVHEAVKPGGHVIVATFAPDGPTHCSGLTVMRYASEELHEEFGPAFDLVQSAHEVHRTPLGTEQSFVYCYCRKP